MNNMIEKENVINILSGTLKALEEKDVVAMKELSNQTIHSASVHQDTNNIAVAVVVYSLAKITERPKYEEYGEWPKFHSLIVKNLEKAIADLKQGKTEQFSIHLSEIRIAVSKLSGNLKRNIEDVFMRAAINKASRIYEHGISMQQTADILGVSIFDLAEYAGRTGISDVELSMTLEVKKRIKTAMELFK